MKKFLFPLLTIAVLVSCSKENPSSENSSDGRVEIKVASQALEVTSRSPFEGTIGENEPLRALVPASLKQGNYSEPYDGPHGYMIFSNNGVSAVGFVNSDDWSTSAAKYYPADPDKKVFLCGLYPHNVWGTSFSTEAKAKIDGKTDLMAAKEILTMKEDVQTGAPKTLEFKHLLTRLDIKLTAENTDAKAAWGNITSLKLSKVKEVAPASQITVDLTSGAVKNNGFTGTDPTMCYNTTNDREITHDAPLTLENYPVSATAYTLCQPVNASSGENHYTLEITTTGHQDTYVIPLTLKYDSKFQGNTNTTTGQAFEVSLTFKVSTIQAKATVAEWEEAGTSEGTIQ